MTNPTLQQLMESEAFIPSRVENAWIKKYDKQKPMPLGLMLAVVNEAEGYRRKLFLSPSVLDTANSSGMFQLVEDSSELTLEQAVESLVGSTFFDLDINVDIGTLKSVIPMYSSYLANSQGSISVTDLSYSPFYEPLVPFTSFAEEKEFSRKYGIAGMCYWGDLGNSVDPDLQNILLLFNAIPFVYSSNWSDSGTPQDRERKDRMGWKGIRKEGKYIEKMLLRIKTETEPGCCGYIIFRHDAKDPRYNEFVAELEQIDGVNVVDEPYFEEHELRKTLPEKRIVVKGNEQLLEKDNLTENDLQLYDADLVQKWQRVKEVLEKYAIK